MSDLRQLAEQATPGPWRAYHRDIGNPSNDPSKDDSSCGLGWELEGPPEPMLRGRFASGYDACLIASMSPERVLAMLDVIRAARTLGKVALSVEGALLAYWTDIPQGVIQDALPRLRAALEESAEALAALDALTGEGDE